MFKSGTTTGEMLNLPLTSSLTVVPIFKCYLTIISRFTSISVRHNKYDVSWSLTWLSPGFSDMFGGSKMNVAAVLSCWKQKLTSASRGDVLHTVIFSIFSGYLPSLYRSLVLPHSRGPNSNVSLLRMYFLCTICQKQKKKQYFLGEIGLIRHAFRNR